MYLKYLWFIIIFLLSACSNEKKENQLFIISKHFSNPLFADTLIPIPNYDSLVKEFNAKYIDSVGLPPPPPPPQPPVPKGFYGEYNFILGSNNNAIFYKVDKRFNGHCYDYEHGGEVDKLLDPQPETIKLNLASFTDFLQNHLLYNDKIVVIASSTDTIKNNFYPEIINFLKKQKFKAIHVRRTSQREDSIIYYGN